MAANKTFCFAKTLADALDQMKPEESSSKKQRLQILGGCTTFAVHNKSFSDLNLSVRNLSELKTIEKRERYFEFGSAVTLLEIENLGASNLPVTVYDAVKTIANTNVKNLATIGGNICSTDFYHTLYASMLALDARLEFQSQQETKFLNMTKFESVPKNSLLTKIRVPISEWEVAVFKRLGPANHINDLSASFVFLANSQKNQISQIRIAFAGKFKFRSLELENKLIGAHLPLSGSTIAEFVLDAEEAFNKAAAKVDANPILIKQFWNLVNYSLEQLT